MKELFDNQTERDTFSSNLKKIRDLEKLYYFLAKYSTKQKHKVIFFSDITTKKINEMFNFFENL